MLTPLNLCILQYQIEEDWFSFCRQETSKEDITGAVPNFPASYLMDTVKDLARKVVLIPGDFPKDQLKILQGGTTPVDTGGKTPGADLAYCLPHEVPPLILVREWSK